ncbi:radical SAM protein [Desulforhopalus sp. 52FAK]
MQAISADNIESIQIETTSRCNLNCVTCLKPAYSEVWQHRDLDKALFQRIVTEIGDIKPNVHLQGWGEPLVQDDFLDYVKILKDFDFSVTFTTNGTLMTSRLAADIIEVGVDGITFSMAGATPATHDELRGSCTFKGVSEGITAFVAAKRKHQADGPVVAISYLLTDTTVKELPKAITWCRRQGVDVFVTVALTQAGGMRQFNLQFLPDALAAKRFWLTRVAANLAGLPGGITLKMKSFAPTLTSVCDKNPINNLFISASGDVAPCVFLAPPVKGPVNWYGKDGGATQNSVSMGNLRTQSLKEIWEGEKYQRFREQFRVRREYHEKRLSTVSCSLAGASQLESAVTLTQNFLTTHPPPGECQYCSKLDGY